LNPPATRGEDHSTWHSENTWWPLPRREFSVRNDYNVLSGSNRHTITPTGWVQNDAIEAGTALPAARW